MARTCGVYSITCTDGRRYIGSGVDLVNRWAVHRYALNKRIHHSAALQAAWLALGHDAFCFELLQQTTPKKLLIVEQKYLDLYRPFDPSIGFNTSPTAGKPKGIKATAETRAKMSIAHKGRKFTEDHRRKIAEALRGRRPSDQCITASIARHTGRKETAESVERRAAALRGFKHSKASVAARAAKRQSLSAMQVLTIKDLRANGMPVKQIAAAMRCSTYPIRKVLTGRYVLWDRSSTPEPSQ